MVSLIGPKRFDKYLPPELWWRILNFLIPILAWQCKREHGTPLSENYPWRQPLTILSKRSSEQAILHEISRLQIYKKPQNEEALKLSLSLALFHSISRGHDNVARVIIQQGLANLNQDPDKIPLVAATIQNNAEMVQLLLENGADPSVLTMTNGSQTCLHIAAIQGTKPSPRNS
ncbi:hypothetical protein AJ79_04078 [Helicocarpus griseus UAMH5409]|uniref:Uncharacterized protein n=1 Tax=Helicocarpus griseus UAMH5409 TaxID=1447875 RepID=A0A2B7XVY2_9EURO|nr:hypothetical protein AJ79_04078 [Helicocarpus griseus UAMH5409]